MIEAITRLLRALHDAGLALEPEELLDALWLAGRWPAPQRPRADAARPPAPVAEPLPPPPSPSSPLPPEERVAPRRYPVSKPLDADSGARPGKAVRLPAGDRPLRIGGLLRALKPLRKLAPSPIDLEPDEEATVDLWCERGVQAIVLRPRPEKVRSVCLVIDSSASMEIWNEVARAWRRALVGSGLFRSVREFRLDSDGAQPRVRPWSARPGPPHGDAGLPKTRRRDGRDQTPKLPLGPEPLVLIFTDACSRAWWNGSAFALAAAWARQAALGLIGLLPETMWHRTAMSRCSFVPLVRPAGGGPLYTLCLPGLGGSGDVIPVASVQEHSLATLALLLGENHREVNGGGLQIDEDEWAHHGAARGPESIGAEERLDRFLRSASPTAVQLARLLSLFNPPSLKAMRLIRAAAGLAATSIHEAEVVLGGLLRIEPGQATGSSAWVYRFHEGVQDLLRWSSERDDPEFQRFAERFRDYLRRRRNEMAGIAGAIPLDSGDSAIRASEDGFLDIDEKALPMVMDDAEDLIALLHQVRDREGAALMSGSLGDGWSGTETPEASDDTAISTSPPDPARDFAGADVPSPAARVSEPVTHFEAPPEIVNTIGMKLKRIPAGEFLMGSPDSDRDADDDEKPQHRVRIEQPFFLGVYPVTQREYMQVIKENPSSRSRGERLPVESVSWFDAVAFCNALSQKEGLPPFYTINGQTVQVPDWNGPGYRLPTEAEWEYACRAGTTTRFSFGDDQDALGQYAWYWDNAKRRTHPVGEKKPNGFGLYDMHGNVWEWCWDAYEADYYKQSPAVDPRGPRQASGGVFRGGSWSNQPRYARSAYRNGRAPGILSHSLGFRLALGSLGEGRSGVEKPEASHDTGIPIRPDQDRDWRGADVPSLTDVGRQAAVFEATRDRQAADVPSVAARVSEPVTHFEAPREIVNSIGMKLKLIPAGEFLMGSPDSDRDALGDEKPQHRVRITRPFYLGVYPVTRGQFRRFVEAISYQTEAEKDGTGGWGWNAAADEWVQDPKFTWHSPGFDQTDDHPVVNVSWNDASAFCDWLSRQESQDYRLPTEAEWEYACRAGTTTRFSFGDDENALGQYAWYYAWYWENANRRTHPVGEKKPNGFGLYDMHGNVLEWCADGYHIRFYKQSSVVDPRGPEPAAHRVLRGGGWRSGPRARSASRSWFPPEHRCSYLGFRLARGQSGR